MSYDTIEPSPCVLLVSCERVRPAPTHGGGALMRMLVSGNGRARRPSPTRECAVSGTGRPLRMGAPEHKDGARPLICQ